MRNPFETLVCVIFRLVTRRMDRLERIMEDVNKEVQDFVGQTEANFMATLVALTAVQAGVIALDDNIRLLVTQIGGSMGLSPDTKALLQKLVDDSANVTAQVKAIDTTIPASGSGS